jgi:hypothetical protein
MAQHLADASAIYAAATRSARGPVPYDLFLEAANAEARRTQSHGTFPMPSTCSSRVTTEPMPRLPAPTPQARAAQVHAAYERPRTLRPGVIIDAVI